MPWIDVGVLGSFTNPLLRVWREEMSGKGGTVEWPIVGGIALGSQDPAGALSLATGALSLSLVDKIGPTHILGTAIWGLSSQKLLNGVSYTNDNLVFNMINANSTGWTGTVTAVAGNVLTVTTTTGALNTLKPWTGNEIGHVRLRRTGGAGSTASALIQSVALPPVNQITVDDAGDWGVGTTLTAASDTVSGAGLNWYDLVLSEFLPATAATVYLSMVASDSGGIGTFYIHPYETYGSGKFAAMKNQVMGKAGYGYPVMSVVSQTIAVAFLASGAGTGNAQMAVYGWDEEAAT